MFIQAPRTLAGVGVGSGCKRVGSAVWGRLGQSWRWAWVERAVSSALGPYTFLVLDLQGCSLSQRCPGAWE